MRKIEKLMIEAINNKTNWKLDNTEVSVIPLGIEVRLHGNLLATVSDSGQILPNIYILKSWPSLTTKSRLRALGVNVYTKKGVTYLNGRAVN